MALMEDGSNGVGTTMLVQPSGFNAGYGNGNGFFGGDWAWLILLLLVGGNGWGFGGFGGMGGMLPMMMGGIGAGMGLDYLYPWLNNSEHISDGFRDQQLQTSIGTLQSSVTEGFGNVQNAMCSGFGQVQLGLAGINQNICQTGNGIVAAVNGAQNSIAQQLYGNQIADMERSYAAQTASTVGMSAIQAQLAQANSENRLASADLKYTIATENCADRTAAMQNTRDIIDAQTRGTQAILDKLCALELDGVKAQVLAEQRENANLRSELMYARGQASQNEQNAFIAQGFANEVDALYNRLNTCPVPTTPVYGRTPIFTCGGQTTGCGCGG